MVRLGVDLQRLADARVHVVGADQHGQLDDLALVEMLAQLGEHGVGHVDVAGHGVGIGERGALALIEERRGAPVGERGALLLWQALRHGQLGHVLVHHIGAAVEIADAHDHDLAQPAFESRPSSARH